MDTREVDPVETRAARRVSLARGARLPRHPALQLLALVALAGGGAALVSGASGTLRRVETARLARTFVTVTTPEDSVALAARILSADRENAEARAALLRATDPVDLPATVAQHPALGALFAHSADGDATLELLEARWRFARGQASATEALRRLRAEGSLGRADRVRLVRGLLRDGGSLDEALAVSVELAPEEPGPLFEVLEALLAGKRAIHRLAAGELARIAHRTGRGAERLLDALAPAEPALAAKLLATTLASDRAPALEERRARLAERLLERIADEHAARSVASEVDLALALTRALPAGDPWGRTVWIQREPLRLVCLGADGAPGGGGLAADVEVIVVGK